MLGTGCPYSTPLGMLPGPGSAPLGLAGGAGGARRRSPQGRDVWDWPGRPGGEGVLESGADRDAGCEFLWNDHSDQQEKIPLRLNHPRKEAARTQGGINLQPAGHGPQPTA